MPANVNPIFTLTPNIGNGQVSVANAGRDGSGTLATVFTPGANGSRIFWVRITATGTTTVNVVRLFLFDGTNNRLFDEILVPAITPSMSVKVFQQDIVYSNPLTLPSTWLLKASTNNAETYNVQAVGGDY